MKAVVVLFALFALALGQNYVRFTQISGQTCTGESIEAAYVLADTCIPEPNNNGATQTTYNATHVTMWFCMNATCDAAFCMEGVVIPIGACYLDNVNDTYSVTAEVNRNLVNDLSDQSYVGPRDILSVSYADDVCSGSALTASVFFTGELCYDNSRLVCTDSCALTYYGGCTSVNETSCGGCSQTGVPVPEGCIQPIGMNGTFAYSKCGAWGYNCSDITTTTGSAATTAAATTTTGGATTTTGVATTTTGGRPSTSTTGAGTTGVLPATTGSASSLSATVATVMVMLAAFML